MKFNLQPTAGVQYETWRQYFEVERAARDYGHLRSANWPAPPDASALTIGAPLILSEVAEDRTSAVSGPDDALIGVTAHDGRYYVLVSAATIPATVAAMAHAREALPEYESASSDVIPVTFWVATSTGGRSIRREIDAAAWSEIEDNYPHVTGLAGLMDPEFRPGVGGQLILWHGPPGTGKTTALRALAREWRGWADLHYIVDPDTFFGHRADYMMEVMTSSEGYHPDYKISEPRWRVLVLEDCGEMLQPDAKREVGQALGRLLNACDGLIGRGLRILVLLTTNEPVEKLHEAVARPGRCAALTEFPTFTREEAAEWLAERDAAQPVGERLALADLYGRLQGFRERDGRRAVGFAA